ncbi:MULTISPECIES: DUF2891 family protein [unclassified Luteococcus]|uniref:DUF2891 family protein n=1 Tax=unclassified Luteococcus TaxID=2639923 RepID=UPI00313E7FDA
MTGKDDELERYAAQWAQIALEVLATPFPYAAAHVAAGEDDCDVTPWVLHPSFHGSLDWHSSAHMQWSLVTLLTHAGGQLEAAGLAERVVATLEERLTPEALAVEASYLRNHPSFERPYGWAWVSLLAAALADCPHPRADSWATAIRPVTDVVAELLPSWLERQTHPNRDGEHTNSAFSLSILHRAFTALGQDDVVACIMAGAQAWYGADTDLDTRLEPSGHDFLSPALSQAQLMAEVLPPDQRAAAVSRLLLGIGEGAHARLLTAPGVVDGTDGKLAHFYGLALSRAWQLRAIAPQLPAQARPVVLAAAESQRAGVLPVVTDGHFMATHWLVSFALLGALTPVE